MVTVGFQHSPRREDLRGRDRRRRGQAGAASSRRATSSTTTPSSAASTRRSTSSSRSTAAGRDGRHRHRRPLLADLGPPVGDPRAHAAGAPRRRTEAGSEPALAAQPLGLLALSLLECQAGTRTSECQWTDFLGGLRMKLKPLGDRLIVKAVEEEETTASGIVLPDTAKEKPQRGKVLAVGDGKIRRGRRQAHPARRGRGRRGPLLQVRRHGDQGRRRRPARPARVGRARQGRRPTSTEEQHMAHKELKYDRRRAGARGRRRRGRQRGQGHARPQGPLRRARQEVRRPHHHQRRRDHRA